MRKNPNHLRHGPRTQPPLFVPYDTPRSNYPLEIAKKRNIKAIHRNDAATNQPEQPPYSEMKMPELIQVAKSKGLKFKVGTKKTDLIALLSGIPTSPKQEIPATPTPVTGTTIITVE